MVDIIINQNYLLRKFFLINLKSLLKRNEKRNHRADVGFINWGHPLLIVGGHHSWGYALWASESLIFHAKSSTKLIISGIFLLKGFLVEWTMRDQENTFPK